MPLEMLKAAKKKTVGIKQTTKAIEKGQVRLVFLARDAESHVAEPIRTLCLNKGITIEEVDSMVDLGRACGIDVGAATASVLD